MNKGPWRGGAAGVIAGALLVLGLPAGANAQYFGQNKVQYEHFKFETLKTPHFDIYFYPEERDAAKEVARMAERWYTRLSKELDHDLSSRQPVILYASHPDFEQTNVIEGELGEGTGGVTEGAKRRVTLPVAASLAETDHVLGHELTHAFQYDILGGNAEGLPLWFIEGMAEYMSLGARDVQTSMWLRDAALREKLPGFKDLDNPKYFPYRFGHAFWAYVGGRYGDSVIGTMLRSLAFNGPGQAGASNRDVVAAIEDATGSDRATIEKEWHSAVQTALVPSGARPEVSTIEPQAIGNAKGQDVLNVGPALSPDGQRIAFLSARDRLSIDLFVGDAATGKNIKKLIDTAADPHFDSLEFLQSAGAWDHAGKRLAIATIRNGKPVLAIVDADRGSITQEIKFPELDEIYQPTWSPDGNSVAFTAQTGGFTDLFVRDLRGGSTKRLTSDVFSDLQPAWSPDGKQIAFVTDRFTTDLAALSYKGYRLATISVDTSSIAPVDTGLSGNVINPQWSADGRQLYFLSDHGGRPNAFRLDLASHQSVQLTDAATGIAGITPLSPALSVASVGGRAAVSVFGDGGYSIHFIETDKAAPVLPTTAEADSGLLPGATKTPGLVNTGLSQPTAGLPPESADYPAEPYKPGLTLVGIGQQVGVATSSMFGTYVMGGIALEFSDMLGNHLLGTSFSINGSVADIAASVTYLNRVNRWNWGLFGERIPLLSGSVNTFLVGGALVQQTDLLRETFTEGGALTAYPLSRATRVEFSTAVRHIGFQEEIETQVIDPFTGQLLADDRQKCQPPLPLGCHALSGPLNLFDFSTALVKDTTTFGATSPILGQRMRFEVAPTFGDLRLNNVTLDARRYFMPARPVTFALRAVHVGRYGSSSEDPRLQPLFLGYSTLVRGYDINSFKADECHANATSTCPEFDRLLGSRMMLFNGEVRAPLVGLFRHRLEYGALPVEIFGFVDSGATWTRDISLGSNGHTFVSSAGYGARVNVLGFLIAEFNMAKPLNRPERGWLFVFNLRPGF